MLNQGKKEPVAEKPRVTIEIENKLKEIEAPHYASEELDGVIGELEDVKKSREYMIQKMYDQEVGSLTKITDAEIRIIWPTSKRSPQEIKILIQNQIRNYKQKNLPIKSEFILNAVHRDLRGNYSTAPLVNAADSDKLNTRLGGLLEKISAINTQAQLEAENKKKMEAENKRLADEAKEKKKTDEAMKLKAKNDANAEAKTMDDKDAEARTTAELPAKASSGRLLRSTSKGLQNALLNRQEKKGQDIEALANTLTAIDVRQFSNLTRQGLLNNLSQDENALAISRHSTQVTEYVLSDIYQDTDLKRTVASIERWIDVAHHLAFEADVKNYHSSMAIYLSLINSDLTHLLNRANISKVPLLSDSAQSKLIVIEELYKPTNNYKNLRDALQKDNLDNRPAIPSMVVHTKDLTAANEGKNYTLMNELNSSLINGIKNIRNTKTFPENSSIAAAISVQIISPSMYKEGASEIEITQHTKADDAYNDMRRKRNMNRDKMVPKGAKNEDILRKLGKSSNHSSKAEVTSSARPQNNTSYLTRSMSKGFQNVFLSRTKSSANISTTVDSVSEKNNEAQTNTANKQNASVAIKDPENAAQDPLTMSNVSANVNEKPANVSQTQTNPSPSIQPIQQNPVVTANKYMRPINEPKQPNPVTPQGRYIPVQYAEYIKTNPAPFKKTPDRDRPNIRPSFTGLERSLASLCVKAEKYNVDISEQVSNIEGMLQIIKDNEEKKKPGTQPDPNAPNIKSVMDKINVITKMVNEGEAEAKAGNVMTPAKNKGP